MSAGPAAGGQNREVRLRAVPEGMPRVEDFDLVEAPAPVLKPGQVLVANSWMSVDPATRVMMLDGDRPYAGTFGLGRPLAGFAVGRVIESRAPGFEVGEALLHAGGWRDLAVVDTAELNPSSRIPADEPAYLGPLGWPGLAAYASVLETADLREGDTVFVSAATGGVGSLVVQIAKRRGHRVIGSAGSAEKVAYALDELGADAAFCYRDGEVGDLLAEAARDGIDVYFDMVGGDHLAAAIRALNPGGRVVLCGAISTYNSKERATGPDLFDAIAKRLTIRGFGSPAHLDRMDDLRRDVGGWLADGSVVFPKTVFEGLDQAPRAMVEMMTAGSIGKTIVKVS